VNDLVSFEEREVAMDPLTVTEQLNAKKTWRFLRIAMVVFVVGLGLAIYREHSISELHLLGGGIDPNHCWQHSISAYYYTPVRGFLVGALVTIGACLVCLKGNTDAEDILLNLAGMFAPVVALVPTPSPGSCASVLGTTNERNADIANNFPVLLGVGLLAIAVLLVLEVISLARGKGGSSTPARIGFLVAVAVLVLGWYMYKQHRGFFEGANTLNAHDTAASLMFACIGLVVLLNAIHTWSQGAVAWFYLATFALMVASIVVFVILHHNGWDYSVIFVEICMISLFALFWIIQTAELWNEGLRNS
jgi:ABC-type Co2+ transport system permease subunit